MSTYHRFFFILLFAATLQFAKGQTVLFPEGDCYIYAAGPKAAEAYGLLDPDTLKTRKSVSSEQFTRETYIMFNLGAIDTTFSSAKVSLYGIVSERKTTQIFYTDTTWQENTLTGNTRPPGTYITDLSLDPGEGYYSWEVADYVNQAISEGRHRIAFIFKDIAGALSTKDTRWHSKENLSGNAPRLELVPGPPVFHRKGAYYIDNESGDDGNSAASPSLAWKSLNKIMTENFVPGDSILFKRGGIWQGQLSFKGSGASGNPILVGSYGQGNKPMINGEGLVENTVQIYGQQYIVMQDLHITNHGDTATFRRAIFVHAEDMGAVKCLYFKGLEISDVNGSMDGEISKNNGGLFLEITGSSRPSYFDTLVIENCYIHDVDRTGISNRSSWDERTLNNNVNWVPNKNVVLRNNTFANTGANGLIVRVAKSPLMEYNLFTHCGLKGSGNACFSFNTDDALWQFNESCFTKYNPGDDDAGGFDSDYDSKNTVIQYNYSHDNEYGALLLTGGPASANSFNDGTIIRYNVLVNNESHVIRTSGSATNSLIYNNTIFSDSSLRNIILVWHKSWEGYAAGTKYYNNIFQAMGKGASVRLESSAGNVFDYNIFFGPEINYQPPDAHKIVLDPEFLSPGSPSGIDSLSGFRLRNTSPAINCAMVVPGNPGRDFEGNTVPTYQFPDRGAFEYTGPYNVAEYSTTDGLMVYPNPARDHVSITVGHTPDGTSGLEIFSIDGKPVFKHLYDITGGKLNILLDTRGSGMSTGFYLVRLTIPQGHSREFVLIIQ